MLGDRGMFKHGPADGSAPAPAKSAARLALQGRNAGVPCRAKRAPETTAIGQPPPECSCGAQVHVRERRNQMRKPLAAWASIRIGKYKHIKTGIELLDGNPQVVHLFAAGFGLSRNDNVRGGAARSHYAANGFGGRVIGAGHDKKYFEVGIVLLRHGSKIFLETGLHSFAGTQKRRPAGRRILDGAAIRGALWRATEALPTATRSQRAAQRRP